MVVYLGRVLPEAMMGLPAAFLLAGCGKKQGDLAPEADADRCLYA